MMRKKIQKAKKKSIRTGAKRKVASTPKEAVGVGTAGRPRHVEATRAVLLALPPEATPEQLAARGLCVDRTHRRAGPKLEEGERKRALTTEAVKEVPQSAPRPPD